MRPRAVPLTSPRAPSPLLPCPLHVPLTHTCRCLLLSALWCAAPAATAALTDARHIAKIKEDAATIRKAQAELTDAGAPANVGAANTFTRWVIYKEKHADAIIDDMGYYHMAQRFPKFEFASEQDKLEALGLHHAVMVAAMKAKQSSEVATSDALDAAIDAVAALPMYNQ